MRCLLCSYLAKRARIFLATDTLVALASREDDDEAEVIAKRALLPLWAAYSALAGLLLLTAAAAGQLEWQVSVSFGALCGETTLLLLCVVKSRRLPAWLRDAVVFQYVCIGVVADAALQLSGQRATQLWPLAVTALALSVGASAGCRERVMALCWFGAVAWLVARWCHEAWGADGQADWACPGLFNFAARVALLYPGRMVRAAGARCSDLRGQHEKDLRFAQKVAVAVKAFDVDVLAGLLSARDCLPDPLFGLDEEPESSDNWLAPDMSGMLASEAMREAFLPALSALRCYRRYLPSAVVATVARKSEPDEEPPSSGLSARSNVAVVHVAFRGQEELSDLVAKVSSAADSDGGYLQTFSEHGAMITFGVADDLEDEQAALAAVGCALAVKEYRPQGVSIGVALGDAWKHGVHVAGRAADVAEILAAIAGHTGDTVVVAANVAEVAVGRMSVRECPVPDALLGDWRRRCHGEPTPVVVCCEDQDSAATRMERNALRQLPSEMEIDLRELRDWREVGHGSFGRVFRAVYARSDDDVAVKEILKVGSGHKERMHFIREMRTLHGLRLRQVLNFYGWARDTATDSLYMVTEFCAHGTLRDMIANPQMCLGDRVCIAIHSGVAVARALTFLHASARCHMDVAARNVLVTLSAEFRLGDFGLLADEGTACAAIAIQWAPPEAVTGKPRASRAHDVWSFGMMMYETLSGKSPFFDMCPQASCAKEFQCAVAQEIASGGLPVAPAAAMGHRRGKRVWGDVVTRCWEQETGSRLCMPAAARILAQEARLSRDIVGAVQSAAPVRTRKSSGSVPAASPLVQVRGDGAHPPGLDDHVRTPFGERCDSTPNNHTLSSFRRAASINSFDYECDRPGSNAYWQIQSQKGSSPTPGPTSPVKRGIARIRSMLSASGREHRRESTGCDQTPVRLPDKGSSFGGIRSVPPDDCASLPSPQQVPMRAAVEATVFSVRPLLAPLRAAGDPDTST